MKSDLTRAERREQKRKKRMHLSGRALKERLNRDAGYPLPEEWDDEEESKEEARDK